MKRLSHAQRVVLVIGWGVLLYVVASYVSVRLATNDAFSTGGWFNYAPAGAKLLPSELGGGPQTAETLVDVGAVILWVVGSLWLLRPSAPTESPPS